MTIEITDEMLDSYVDDDSDSEYDEVFYAIACELRGYRKRMATRPDARNTDALRQIALEYQAHSITKPHPLSHGVLTLIDDLNLALDMRDAAREASARDLEARREAMALARELENDQVAIRADERERILAQLEREADRLGGDALDFVTWFVAHIRNRTDPTTEGYCYGTRMRGAFCPECRR